MLVIAKKTGMTREPMGSAPTEMLDAVLTSELRSDLFRNVSEQPLVLASTGITAISSVNITNYDDFIWTDPQACAVFRSKTREHEFGSVETTHGVIRIAAEAFTGKTPKFLDVSGIVNSLGMFDMEVAPRVHAQNLVCARNAGMALLWLLVELAGQPTLAPDPEPPPCA